jgi:hypothetical protein
MGLPVQSVGSGWELAIIAIICLHVSPGFHQEKEKRKRKEPKEK